MQSTETTELVAGHLRVCCAQADGVPCLRLEGQLDGESALPFARMLLDAQLRGGTLMLDLARLSFLDLTGLRVLVDAARRSCSSGGDLVLRAPSPAARRLFRLTGLDAWSRLDADGCVLASLGPMHRAMFGRFGRRAT